MAKVSLAPEWQRALVILTGTVVGVTVIACLYWAQVVLIPVALALFLTFLLGPLDLLVELPAAVDPCGERGEFHTFCYAGPIFSGPIPIRMGEHIVRDGFHFADLLSMPGTVVATSPDRAIELQPQIVSWRWPNWRA